MPDSSGGDSNAVRSFNEALGGDWSVASRLAAISRSFAIVELTPDGRVIHANAIFLKIMGYTMPDVRNRHHKMFCFPEFAEQAGYHKFWARLLKGEHVDDKQLRRRADGQPVWLQAVYVPVFTAQGKVDRVLKVAVDITTAQLAKFDAENQMAALGRSIATIEFGVDGKILSANDNFLEIFGYASDEIVGEHHSALCDDDYVLSEEYALFWKRLRCGDFHTGVYPRRHRDGARVWLSASYNPITDLTGNVVKVVKFAQNVTEYYERATASVQQIASLMTTQAVIDCDLTGRIMDANAIFLGRTRRRLDEIVGQPVADLFHDAADLLDPRGEVWAQIIGGTAVTYDLAMVYPGEAVLWWRAGFTVIRDGDGDPVKIVVTATDITTERRLANEAMAQNFAMDAAFARAEFGEDGTILAVNDRFLDAIGYTREELVGQHHSLLFDTDEAYGMLLTTIWEPLTRGEPVSTRIRRKRANGEVIWLQVGYSPVRDTTGRLLKVIACGFDITRTMETDAAIADGINEIDRVLRNLQAIRGQGA